MGKDKEQTSIIRYAPYVEGFHVALIQHYALLRENKEHFSPFADYEAIPMETAFFGLGFALADFPSLYDMYGKFMAGLDIEVLYGEIFEDTVDGPHVNALVAAEAALMDDDLVKDALPRFQVGMRDINSVVSSSYIIGKAMLEDARVKALSKFSAELKYRLIPVATERWTRHLEWNKNVVGVYAEIIKLFLSAKVDIDEHNLNVATKGLLWSYTLVEYERLLLGTLQGAQTKTSVAGQSQIGKAIAGTLGGAAMGAMFSGGGGAATGLGAGGLMAASSGAAGVGSMSGAAAAGSAAGPWGMVIGGAIGLAASL